MKKALLISLTILSALALANEAGAAAPVGTFVRTVDSAMIGYENQAVCESDGGRWIEGDCVFSTQDVVRVSVLEDGALKLFVNTVGPTSAECEYEGTAQIVGENTILSSRPVRVWNGSGFQEASCDVRVTTIGEGQVSVRTNDKCQQFCGPRAWLDIEAATRR